MNPISDLRACWTWQKILASRYTLGTTSRHGEVPCFNKDPDGQRTGITGAKVNQPNRSASLIYMPPRLVSPDPYTGNHFRLLWKARGDFIATAQSFRLVLRWNMWWWTAVQPWPSSRGARRGAGAFYGILLTQIWATPTYNDQLIVKTNSNWGGGKK